MKPYGDRIVIKAIAPEEVSSGGIIVPDVGHERALPGTVVSVGPGYPGPTGWISCMSREGDKVIYPKFGCHEFEHEGEKYLIIRESELFVNLTQNQ